MRICLLGYKCSSLCAAPLPAVSVQPAPPHRPSGPLAAAPAPWGGGGAACAHSMMVDLPLGRTASEPASAHRGAKLCPQCCQYRGHLCGHVCGHLCGHSGQPANASWEGASLAGGSSPGLFDWSALRLEECGTRFHVSCAWAKAPSAPAQRGPSFRRLGFEEWCPVCQGKDGRSTVGPCQVRCAAYRIYRVCSRVFVKVFAVSDWLSLW